MKYHLIFFLFLATQYANSLIAQDVIIVESEKIDDNLVNIAPVKIEGGYISVQVENRNDKWDDPKMNPLSILNKDLNYTYVSDEDNVYISLMDDDLNLLAQNKLKFKGAKDVNIYGMFHYEGKTTLYYTQRKNFATKVEFYAMEIDMMQLKRNKSRKIHTIKHRDGTPATRMIVSPDSTKISFISERYAGDNDKRKLDIALFNIEGTPMWSDPVFFEEETKRLTIGDAALDNDGNIYVSYKLYDKHRENWSKKNKNGEEVPAYKTRVVTYGLDETEAFVTLDDADNYIRRCDLIYNSIKKKMQAVGTYSTKDGGNLTGTYVAEIDPINVTTTGTIFHKFDDRLIQLIDRDGFGQTKDKDPGVEVRTVHTNMHIKENGDLVYIMQPYRFDRVFTNNGGFNTMNRTVITGYNAFSIIVSQISDNGATYTRIPRRSIDLSPFGSIIAKTIYSNENVYLLYTDHHQNLEREDEEDPRTMGNPMRRSFVLANIDSFGKYNRSFLKNRDQEENFSLSMGDVFGIGDNAYMYTFYRGGLFSGRRHIGVVTFNQ